MTIPTIILLQLFNYIMFNVKNGNQFIITIITIIICYVIILFYTKGLLLWNYVYKSINSFCGRLLLYYKDDFIVVKSKIVFIFTINEWK